MRAHLFFGCLHCIAELLLFFLQNTDSIVGLLGALWSKFRKLVCSSASRYGTDLKLTNCLLC